MTQEERPLGSDKPGTSYEFKVVNGNGDTVYSFMAATWKNALSKFHRYLDSKMPKEKLVMSGSFYPSGWGEAIYNPAKGKIRK